MANEQSEASTARGSWRIDRRVLSTIVVVGFLSALFAFGLFRVLLPKSDLIIRNATGGELTDVHLTLHDTAGAFMFEEQWPGIDPDSDVAVGTYATDFAVTLRFTLRGQLFIHKEPYIDLWFGEGWIWEVEEGGGVTGSYRRE